MAQVLREVVSEKTGYPQEMLELDMELEADLGIDSIKRVEILAALQERLPEIPAIQSEQLGTLRTLRQIVAFTQAQPGADSIPQPARSSQVSGLLAGAGTQSATAVAMPESGRVDEAQAHLKSVVAEKTGYPVEMLELDMDLEADLGIDSIKRVEILAGLHERMPHAPAIQADQLGTLRTLRQMLQHLQAGAATGSSARHASAEPAVLNEPIPVEPLAADVLPHGASDAHDPSPGLERWVLTQIALSPAGAEGLARPDEAEMRPAAGAEIWLAGEDSELLGALARRLEALQLKPVRVPAGDAGELRVPEALAGLVILAPSAAANGTGDRFLRESFRVLQRAGPGLRRVGRSGGAFLVTIARLDGAFGLREMNGQGVPESGGLAGLVKTVRHEWPEVRAKALDLAPEFSDVDAAAAAVVDEFFRVGPEEVGLTPQGRFALRLEAAPLAAPSAEPPLRAGDVVVASGGARGITAEVCVALARAYHPVLVLLGRSPEPQPEPAWLVQLTREAQIKQALVERANGNGSLKALELEYRRIAASREVAGNLARIEAAGASVLYRALDVRDAGAVREALDAVRGEFGEIKGLLHAAGVIADRHIEEKTPEQFDRVYGTKVEGLRNLLQALHADELKVLVLFSSSSGRFGRRGQADYAVANEVLNKMAQQQARVRPACRVLSVNWGPWEGGMVTPGLRKAFAEEGVGLIGLQAGAQFLVGELGAGGDGHVEVTVLAGAPDRVAPARLPTLASVAEAREASAAEVRHAPAPELTLAFERVLDLARHPFLTSHVLDGRPVLPLAMSAEWLAQGALHLHPGLQFHGFNDLRLLKGIGVGSNGTPARTLRILAGKPEKRDGFTSVPVELWSRSGVEEHPGQDEQVAPAQELHARAEILLASQLPEPGHTQGEPAIRDYPKTLEEVYTEVLFHGPALRGLERVEGCSEAGIVALARTAPEPAAWMSEPLRGTWLADPLALDVAFQMMILWSVERYRAGSLPCTAGRYRQFRRNFPRDGVRIVIRVTKDRDWQAAADVEFIDREGGLVATVSEYTCAIDHGLLQAFRKNQIHV